MIPKMTTEMTPEIITEITPEMTNEMMSMMTTELIPEILTDDRSGVFKGKVKSILTSTMRYTSAHLKIECWCCLHNLNLNM